MQLVSSDIVAPFGIDSIRVDSNFMFVGMSREEEGIVKVYNLAAGGASHQLTGHKVCVTCSPRGTLHHCMGHCITADIVCQNHHACKQHSAAPRGAWLDSAA